MNLKQLVFLLSVAVFVSALSVAPSMEIGNGIILDRQDVWNYGFGPACVALGLVLGVASIAAWRGSPAANKICLWWAAQYSLVVGSLVIWHFPDTVLYTTGIGLGWAVLWYFSIHRWLSSVSV